MKPALARARRHQAILDLVRERAISSQNELARLLARRGHHVTQATLSRDLKALRVFRVPGGDGYRYRGAEDAPPARDNPRLGAMAAAEVLEVVANETVAVVRTQVGRAQGVAVYLDALRLPEVLATVGGDDTVLVIPRSTRDTARLERRLNELFELAPGDGR